MQRYLLLFNSFQNLLLLYEITFFSFPEATKTHYRSKKDYHKVWITEFRLTAQRFSVENPGPQLDFACLSGSTANFLSLPQQGQLSPTCEVAHQWTTTISLTW